MKRLLIVGAGGHGRSVAEAACAAGQYAVVGFIDDVTEVRQVWAWPAVVGATSDLAKYRDLADAAIVAIGKNDLREKLCERLQAANFELATIVHPRAIVSPSAMIGVGSAIMAGAIVGTEAELGIGAIVNCGAVVDHHCQVQSFGHLGVNAAMAGGSVLGRGAWMQAGSALGYGVKVAAWAVLEPGQALRTK
ncbi:acetyltransferase [Ralstonia insidiosa]|uniref:Acetyltransferase n=1 Tax=Ralstonia insidiosa TaxID=190721 RepID=A0A848P983_9RALS|nr:acetyltransferase [Ralstonia insidiosa]NMV41895.1 acetyltransferase [Ralstonia insidiosa]